MDANPAGSNSFFNASLSRIIDSLRVDVQFVPATPVNPSDNPFLVGMLSYLAYILSIGGYLILLATAIVGSLIYLKPQNRTVLRIAIILTAASLIVIPRAFGLLHVTGILPERWVNFQYMPLSILGIQGLIGISNIVRSNLIKLCLIMVVALAILFAMTDLNSTANSDSPILNYKSGSRTAYTESEISVIRTLSDMGAGRPTTDEYYSFIFSYILGEDACVEMVQRPNEVFVLRNYFLHHPEWDNSYDSRIRQVTIRSEAWDWQQVIVMDYLKEQGIDKTLIYNNGTVKVYTIT